MSLDLGVAAGGLAKRGGVSPRRSWLLKRLGRLGQLADGDEGVHCADRARAPGCWSPITEQGQLSSVFVGKIPEVSTAAPVLKLLSGGSHPM